MRLLLSWDLFIIAIFIIIIAYSYIIGSGKSVKTIISSYLAILVADGLGNIADQYFFVSSVFQQIMRLAGAGSISELLVGFKVIVFTLTIVILTVRGVFDVRIPRRSSFADLLTTGIFGFFNAGLVISTLSVYVSGLSLIRKDAVANSNIEELYHNSAILKIMVDYYDFWFAIPVLIILIWSIFFNDKE